jgi:hypothetical protein
MTNSPQTSALMKRHAEECTDWMLTADSVARLCARMEHERNIALEALTAINRMDTSQDASPNQCGAVLVAMDALQTIKDANP